MRKTQIEQIKEAKRAYLTVLNNPRDGMSALRFSVHLDSGDGLDILWPSDSHLSKSKELLSSQVYSKRKTYPAYHFSLSGCGYSKTYEIAIELQKINPNLDVYELTGWSPSLIKEGDRSKVYKIVNG